MTAVGDPLPSVTVDTEPRGGTAGPGPSAGTAARVAAAASALATMVVLVAVAIALFFNPAWVAFEQGRSRADLWTGWTQAEVRQATDAIVAEVYFGPGTFEQVVRGEPVLNPRERLHMANVRTVWLGFLVIAAAAAVLLVAAWALRRNRAGYWRAVARGSAVLAAGTVVVGLAFALLFDPALELFHRLFFAEGSYTFDPRTERLVQLLPYTFWTETTVAISVVVCVLALATWAIARRRARRAEAAR